MIFNKNTAFLLGLVLTLQPILAEDKNFEFNFWTSKSTKLDKRVLNINDHPCGEVAVAKISKLPKHSAKGALIPERVFELNESGKIIKQWVMPVDSDFRAIRGDELYVDLNQKTYRISLNRMVVLSKNPPERAPGKDVKCKSPLAPSAYLACVEHKDIGSGIPRILSYEMVCT